MEQYKVSDKGHNALSITNNETPFIELPGTVTTDQAERIADALNGLEVVDDQHPSLTGVFGVDGESFFKRMDVILSADFIPTMKVSLDDNLLEQLKSIQQPNDGNVVKSQADLMLAAWFSKMNEIELADRTQYTIKSKVVDCTKWPNGKVRLCKLNYYFAKIVNLLN